jgi:hypothetical protein
MFIDGSDAAADCTALLRALHDLGVYFLVKARVTQDLANAVTATHAWCTVDADERATRQVATIPFARKGGASKRSP